MLLDLRRHLTAIRDGARIADRKGRGLEARTLVDVEPVDEQVFAFANAILLAAECDYCVVRDDETFVLVWKEGLRVALSAYFS